MREPRMLIFYIGSLGVQSRDPAKSERGPNPGCVCMNLHLHGDGSCQLFVFSQTRTNMAQHLAQSAG